MERIDEMEKCSIINSKCPYDHSCNVCRLHNDYETALEKSRERMEKLEGSKE